MQIRNEDLTWREIDGELVILDLASSTYLTTNRTGTFLLQQLVEERSHEDLVNDIVAAFDVEPDTAEHDVAAFVELLRARNLLATPSATNA